jgi:hypothetical protein
MWGPPVLGAPFRITLRIIWLADRGEAGRSTPTPTTQDKETGNRKTNLNRAHEGRTREKERERERKKKYIYKNKLARILE